MYQKPYNLNFRWETTATGQSPKDGILEDKKLQIFSHNFI